MATLCLIISISCEVAVLYTWGFCSTVMIYIQMFLFFTRWKYTTTFRSQRAVYSGVRTSFGHFDHKLSGKTCRYHLKISNGKTKVLQNKNITSSSAWRTWNQIIIRNQMDDSVGLKSLQTNTQTTVQSWTRDGLVLFWTHVMLI